MSNTEWIKFTYEEINAIEASLEMSKIFLTKALDKEIEDGTANVMDTEDAKRLIGIFDTLLAKLDE